MLKHHPPLKKWTWQIFYPFKDYLRRKQHIETISFHILLYQGA
jgi:hypothetical protein